MTVGKWVELVLAATMFVSMTGLIANRLVSQKGIGQRAIQFAVASAIAPLVGILALAHQLDNEAVVALISAVVGYTLSSFSPRDNTMGRGGP